MTQLATAIQPICPPAPRKAAQTATRRTDTYQGPVELNDFAYLTSHIVGEERSLAASRRVKPAGAQG